MSYFEHLMRNGGWDKETGWLWVEKGKSVNYKVTYQGIEIDRGKAKMIGVRCGMCVDLDLQEFGFLHWIELELRNNGGLVDNNGRIINIPIVSNPELELGSRKLVMIPPFVQSANERTRIIDGDMEIRFAPNIKVRR